MDLENDLTKICDVLHKLALRYAEEGQLDAVHFLVNEIRRLERLPRALEMRYGLPHQ